MVHTQETKQAIDNYFKKNGFEEVIDYQSFIKETRMQYYDGYCMELLRSFGYYKKGDKLIKKEGKSLQK